MGEVDVCPEVYSDLPQKLRRCFTASFGRDVNKLSVPGDFHGLISLWLSLRALVSYHHGGKPIRVLKQQQTRVLGF